MQYGVWRVQLSFKKGEKRKARFWRGSGRFLSQTTKVAVLDNDEEEISNVFQVMKSLEEGIFEARQNRQPRGPVVNREHGKVWWRNAYQNWEDHQFKERFRINRETPFLQQKWGTNLAISGIRTTASTVDVRHLNHHTANVGSRCILDFISPTTESRTITTSIPQGGPGHTRFTNSHAASHKN